MSIARGHRGEAPVGFYREVLSALTRADVPFLVGGAYAFCRHAAIDRKTKDLDLMIERGDLAGASRAPCARAASTRASTFPHWLGKALSPAGQVDIIFNGGSGLTPVDARLVRARRARDGARASASGSVRPRS